jgi:hypothetical protein
VIQVLKSVISSFEAEIVEVFEKNGRRVAKALVHPFFVEIDAAELKDAHLGDTIRFSAGPAGSGGAAGKSRRSR